MRWIFFNKKPSVSKKVKVFIRQNNQKITIRRKKSQIPDDIGERYEEIECRGGKVLQRRRGLGGNVRLSHLLKILLFTFVNTGRYEFCMMCCNSSGDDGQGIKKVIFVTAQAGGSRRQKRRGRAPRGIGCGEGAVPPPQKIFGFLILKW